MFNSSPIVLTSAADPVAAFWQAHRIGAPIAVHTSGTSQTPRTVLRSTASWFDSFDLVAHRIKLTSQSRFAIPGPLAATMNLFIACVAEHAGASWSAHEPRPTHLALTPAALSAALARNQIQAGVTVLVAGDGLHRQLRDEAREKGIRVEHYYGATELSFVAWGSCRDDLQPFDQVEIKIIDQQIWVRSPWLSAGPSPGSPVGQWQQSHDGFASVGDRGELDAGFVRVHGRADAITTGGATVALGPLTGRLRAHARADIHLVGIPHATLGQVLGCAVTDPTDLSSLREWTRRNLPPAQRPRIWAVIPDPPLTPTGKLDQTLLARQFEKGARR